MSQKSVFTQILLATENKSGVCTQGGMGPAIIAQSDGEGDP